VSAPKCRDMPLQHFECPIAGPDLSITASPLRNSVRRCIYRLWFILSSFILWPRMFSRSHATLLAPLDDEGLQ